MYEVIAQLLDCLRVVGDCLYNQSYMMFQRCCTWIEAWWTSLPGKGIKAFIIQELLTHSSHIRLIVMNLKVPLMSLRIPRIITTKPVMLEDVTGSRTSVFRLSDDCHICEPTQICDQNGAPVVRLLLLLSFGRCQTGSTCGCWFVMVPYLFWLFGQKYAHGWSLCMGSCSWAGCR